MLHAVRQKPKRAPKEGVMDMDRLSASVEEACLNAWPALKEILYDGWLIRLANGETRRTNSVNVIGHGVYGADEKIAYCERIYREHGQATCFRIRSNCRSEERRVGKEC